MTGKEKLQLILDGQIPNSPPHWELVFQIAKEMMGSVFTFVATRCSLSLADAFAVAITGGCIK